MATKAEITTQKSKVIDYSQKFGLDKERKKLIAGLKDFNIVKITMTDSKKRYDGLDPETDEIVHGKKKIAQIDIVSAEGKREKYYAMNTAIVEACQGILDDEDTGADKEGNLTTPVHINEIIEGLGEQKRKYIAFT